MYICIHQSDLIDMDTLRNIDVFLVLHCQLDQGSTPFLSISLSKSGKHCQLRLPAEIKVQTRKNYETCKDRYKLCHINKWVKVQHEKKPVLNLKCMQIVGFEQTSALTYFWFCFNCVDFRYKFFSQNT